MKDIIKKDKQFYIPAKIHIFDSKESPSPIFLGTSSNKLYYDNHIMTDDVVNKHIYITSNETPVIGNWVCHGLVDLVYRVNGDNFEACIHNKCRKIILTTDKAIYTDEPITGKDISYGFASYIPDKEAYYKNLPGLSVESIEWILNVYNNNNQVVDVLVGLTKINGVGEQENVIDFKLKISKDNTAHVFNAKETNYTESEVRAILDKCFLQCANISHEKSQEWINDNLKK